MQAGSINNIISKVMSKVINKVNSEVISKINNKVKVVSEVTKNACPNNTY